MQKPTRLCPALAAVALAYVCPHSLAGPPLAIGDPGVLQPWQWEIITAGTVSSTDAGDYHELPLLDVSVGLIRDRLQISVVYPYVNAHPDPGRSDWGFGNLEIGATLRLVTTNRVRVALAPAYAFAPGRAATRNGIGFHRDAAAIPLNAELQVADRWRLNAEASYLKVQHDPDAWVYGAAAAYMASARWELLFELSGTADTQMQGDVLEARVGFDATLTDSCHLLFSVATGLREPAGENKLDYGLFIGLQFVR